MLLCAAVFCLLTVLFAVQIRKQIKTTMKSVVVLNFCKIIISISRCFI